eukprot:4696395-Pleurochrysis_carterae.AAC.2
MAGTAHDVGVKQRRWKHVNRQTIPILTPLPAHTLSEVRRIRQAPPPARPACTEHDVPSSPQSLHAARIADSAGATLAAQA